MVNAKVQMRTMLPMRFIVAGLLFQMIVQSPTYATVRIDGDMGGPLGEYLLRFAHIRDSGERVVIDGNCYSACTLVTALVPRDRICVTQRARLGFHASWFINKAGEKAMSPAGTGVLYEMYPPLIRNWINRKGGLGRETIVLDGRDLASIYRPCN